MPRHHPPGVFQARRRIRPAEDCVVQIATLYLKPLSSLPLKNPLEFQARKMVHAHSGMFVALQFPEERFPSTGGQCTVYVREKTDIRLRELKGTLDGIAEKIGAVNSRRNDQHVMPRSVSGCVSCGHAGCYAQHIAFNGR